LSPGLKKIDYFIIGNKIQENGQDRNNFTEKVLQIKGSGICFDMLSSDRDQSKKFTRAELNLSRNNTVLVSGANFYNIIPELVHLWGKIIAAVHDSVPILYPFGPA
jgi:predicted O-linked N-acetylglucosamine transferase (SPINDLY family)